MSVVIIILLSVLTKCLWKPWEPVQKSRVEVWRTCLFFIVTDMFHGKDNKFYRTSHLFVFSQEPCEVRIIFNLNFATSEIMMERDLGFFLGSRVSDIDVETVNFRTLNRERS